MIEARLKAVVPTGCKDFHFEVKEETREVEELPPAPPAREEPTIDDDLYWLMANEPAYVAAILKHYIAARR